MNSLTKRTQIALAAIALLTLGAVSARAAVPPAMPLKIGVRAITPQDKKDYGLTTAQLGSGLNTVGVGQPAYLETMIPLTVPETNFISVEWELAAKPLGSSAELLTSPLGANVPVGSVADRHLYWLGGRTMLLPDLEGGYTVNARVTYVTGVSNLTTKIVAARYIGFSQGCAACHTGGILAPDMSIFTNTPHATAYTRKIDDATGHFGANCVSCHSVGYDTSTNSNNGGWDDVARELNYVFPDHNTNGNWAATPAKLKNVSNIQCENCHGPGSEHVMSDGVLGNPASISVSMDSETCGACHDSKSKHYRNAEWNNSLHAMATPAPTGPGREGCVRCHAAKAYVANLEGVSPLPTAYDPIGCSTCHDPHVDEHPGQLRFSGPVTLMDGFTKIENAGSGSICMTCHLSRRNATNYVEVTTGGGTFGPHGSCQADMLAGANAITYGKVIPSNAHKNVLEDGCVSCHMQDVMATDPAFTLAGGHTFSVAAETTTNKIELTEGCAQCHGDIEEFNFARQDFDGDGVTEGVQDEVKGLMAQLAYLLPPANTPKEDITITSSWNLQQKKAGYNYRFVQEDGSFGIHNLSYAVGLLRASIADMTGDSNNDRLADSWQVQYFGSANSPDAAPNATPAKDGVPNWLKWSLGLDPWKAGVVVPDGVVWTDAGMVGGSTNTIQIYTAAEISFNTEAGKKYQLQSISSLGTGWSNIGDPIDGDGNARSFVTPTRKYPEQYFRVMVQ